MSGLPQLSLVFIASRGNFFLLLALWQESPTLHNSAGPRFPPRPLPFDMKRKQTRQTKTERTRQATDAGLRRVWAADVRASGEFPCMRIATQHGHNTGLAFGENL